MGKKKPCRTTDTKYPSAELLVSACYEDYKRLIDTYDKIYEKINIALAFCGIILLVILERFDYRIFFSHTANSSSGDLFALFVQIICSCTSTVCIIWAVIQLLILVRSKEITVFDSVAIRNDKIYGLHADEASLWLIDKYTLAISGLRTIIHNKQRAFDAIVVKIIISVLTYSVLLIVTKGV
jgi:hypothetical protein